MLVDDVVRPRRRGGGAIGRSLFDGLLHWNLSSGEESFDLVEAETRSIAVLPFLFLLIEEEEGRQELSMGNKTLLNIWISTIFKKKFDHFFVGILTGNCFM